MFKLQDKVHCLLNGEGEISLIKDNTISVLFESGIEEYSLDGRIIVNGKPSKNIVLFKEEPVVVTHKALYDIERKIIQDKDFIVFGNKQDFIFRAGFYDEENNSVFTKEGVRNLNSVFNNLSNNVFILKIDINDYIKNKINKLNETISNSDNSTNIETPLIYEQEKENSETQKTASKQIDELLFEDEPNIQKTASTIEKNENSQIEKKPTESKGEQKQQEKEPEEKMSSVPITLKGAKIINIVPNNNVIQVIDESTVVFNEHKRDAYVTFELVNSPDITTYLTIGGKADQIARISQLKDSNPKNYLNVADFYVKKISAKGEDEYVNVPEDSVRMTRTEDRVVISL